MKLKALLLSLTFLLSLGSQAETGVSDKMIILGQSAAMSGPAAALGSGMKSGAMAYFKKINASGGVNGRSINLISRDDGYEPERTADNTAKLIDHDKSFMLFGFVGTPTTKAAVPLVDKANIPMVGLFTGAETFRDPVNKNIYNIRASYYDEAEALIAGAVDQMKLKKIGVFVQDDAYGAAVEAGVKKALDKRKLSITGRGIYKRNTVEVSEGLKELKAANPQAIVMVGTYKAVAAFVKQAKAEGLKSKFLNVSFVGTSALIRELGAEGNGVYISQVTPSPWDTSIPVVKEYQEAMGKTDYDYTSLEGFISAKVAVDALKAAGPTLTRDSLRAALDKLNTDVGGYHVSFSPTNHSGSQKVWMTEIKGGKAVPITKM